MKLKLLILLISIGGSLIGQDIPIQGVFLSRADKMLKDDSAVFKFVDYMTRHELNTVILYGSTTGGKDLNDASFKLKDQIDSASFGKYDWVTVASRTQDIKDLDSLPSKFVGSFYEYEFWRSLHRNFNFYGRQLFRLDLKPLEQPLWLYIGWLARNDHKAKLQAYRIVEKADVLAIHVYMNEPNVYYVAGRLKLVAESAKLLGKTQKIVFLFSAEPRYSSNYLIQNTYQDGYRKFMDQIYRSEELNKYLPYLDFQGFAIFSYNRRHH